MRLRDRAIAAIVSVAMAWNGSFAPVAAGVAYTGSVSGTAEAQEAESSGDPEEGAAGAEVRGASDATASGDASGAGQEVASDGAADGTGSAAPSSSSTASGASDADQSLGVSSPQPTPTETRLERTLHSVDGHSYVVCMTVGENAGIPSDAQLQLTEVVLAPTQEELDNNPDAYKDRPYETELWASEDDLAHRAELLSQALATTEDDYVAWSKYLQVRIIAADGHELQPAAPVALEVETDAVAPEMAPALEAALVDGEPAAPQVAERASRIEMEPDGAGGEREHAWSRMKITADRTGEFALAVVATPVSVWELRGGTAAVLAPRYGMEAYVEEFEAVAPEGSALEPELGFTAVANPATGVPDASSGKGVKLWLRLKLTEGSTGILSAWRDGSQTLTSGAATPEAIASGERIDLLFDPADDDGSLVSGDITLTDELPETDTTPSTDVPSDTGAASENDENDNALSADTSSDASVASEQDGADSPHSTGAPSDSSDASEGDGNDTGAPSDAIAAFKGDGNDTSAPTAAPTSTDTTSPAPAPTIPAPAADTRPTTRPEGVERTFVASDGLSYRVRATTTKGSGIPAGAELVVTEHALGGMDYLSYVSRAENELAVRHANLDFAKVLDIALVDGITGAELEPLGDVDISIELIGQEVARDAEVGVVHFGAVPEAVSSQVTANGADGTTVAFATDSFSVFVVMGYSAETYYRDSAGDTWKVTATYGPETGLPNGVELRVRELGAEEAAAYAAPTAEALGKPGKSVNIAKAFDISFVKDGTEYHKLDGEVEISIELLDGSAAAMGAMEVVHFGGDNGEQAERVDSETVGNTVSFSSDEFSVYVVTETDLMRHYVFMNNGSVFAEQVLIEGESLCRPPDATKTGAVFSHWATTEGGAQAVTFTEPEYQNIHIDPGSISGATNREKQEWLDRDENKVKFYAVYEMEKVVIAFYNQSGLVVQKVEVNKPASGEDAVILDTTLPEYDYVPVQDKEGAFIEFEYWTDNPRGSGDKLGTNKDGKLAITADETRSVIELYPVLEEGHYVYFNSNRKTIGNASASYVPPVFLQNQTGQREANIAATARALENLLAARADKGIPTANGYSFKGWYLIASDSNDGEGEGQNKPLIENKSGTLTVNTDELTKLFDAFGNLPNNPTLFAHWTPNTKSSYTIVVWKQNVNDPSSYDYVESVTVPNVDTGSEPGTYFGKEYASAAENGFSGPRVSASSDTVLSDGSTVVNVYYDRQPVTIFFKTYKKGGTNYEIAADNSTPQYGLVNGSFVQLTRENIGTTHTYIAPVYTTSTSTYSGNYYIISENTYVQQNLYRNNKKWWKNCYYSWGRPVYEDEYTGPVFTTNRSVNYTGDRYNRFGNSYTLTTDDGDGLYGLDENGNYVSLSYEETTSYRWTYNGEEYAGTRYKQTTGTGYGWYDYKVFSGLYGQTFEQNGLSWPTEHFWYTYGFGTGGNYAAGYYNGYPYNEGDTGGTRTTFLQGFLPTDAEKFTLVFYGSAPSGTIPVQWHKQDIGADGKAAGTYTRANVAQTTGGNFNITDKYNGFTAYQYSVDGGAPQNVGTKNPRTGVYGGEVSYTSSLDIYFVRNTHSIEFRMNDGTNAVYKTESSVPFESPLVNWRPVQDPTRDDYIFGGWYYDSGDNQTVPVDFAATTAIMPDSNLVVYAKWMKVKYRATLIPNGGAMNGQDVGFNLDPMEKISLGEDPTRDYVKVEDGQGDFVYDEVKGTYTQAAAAGEGNYIEKVGAYVFLGWYEAQMDPASVMDAEHQKLEQYTNTSGDIRYRYIQTDKDSGAVGTPMRDASGDYKVTSRYNLNIAPNRAITLVAKWQRAGGFFVRYEIKDDKLPASTSYATIQTPQDDEEYIDNAHAVVLAPLGAPRGYALDYWEGPVTDSHPDGKYLPNQLLDIRESLAKAEGSSMVITLTARYRPYVPSERTMADYTFLDDKDGDGNYDPESEKYEVQRIAVGEELKAPITPSKQGYSFKGWYYDKEGTRRFNGFGVVADPVYTTLYALYDKTFTVNYHLTKPEVIDPTAAGADKVVLVTQTYKDPGAGSAEDAYERLDTRHVVHPVDKDHYVVMWVSDWSKRDIADGNSAYQYPYNSVSDNRVKSDLDLYAVLKERQYVEFDSQGGSFVATQEIPVGGWPVRPDPAPTRKGYDFLGWFTHPTDPNSVYDFDRQLNESETVLYAHWSPNGTEKGNITVVWWAQTADRPESQQEADADTDHYQMIASRVIEAPIGEYDLTNNSDLTKINLPAGWDNIESVVGWAKTAGQTSATAFLDDNGSDLDDLGKYYAYSNVAAKQIDNTAVITDKGDTTLNIRFDLLTYTLIFNVKLKPIQNQNQGAEFGKIYIDRTNYKTGDQYRVTAWLKKNIASQWPVDSTAREIANGTLGPWFKKNDNQKQNFNGWLWQEKEHAVSTKFVSYPAGVSEVGKDLLENADANRQIILHPLDTGNTTKGHTHYLRRVGEIGDFKWTELDESLCETIIMWDYDTNQNYKAYHDSQTDSLYYYSGPFTAKTITGYDFIVSSNKLDDEHYARATNPSTGLPYPQWTQRAGGTATVPHSEDVYKYTATTDWNNTTFYATRSGFGTVFFPYVYSDPVTAEYYVDSDLASLNATDGTNLSGYSRTDDIKFKSKGITLSPSTVVYYRDNRGTWRSTTVSALKQYFERSVKTRTWTTTEQQAAGDYDLYVYYRPAVYSLTLYEGKAATDTPFASGKVEYMEQLIGPGGVLNDPQRLGAVPNAPDGFEFGGWSLIPGQSDPTLAYGENGGLMPARNLVLYAIWTPITYQVTTQGVDATGNANDGAESAVYTADYGQHFKELKVPNARKDGYLFGGWQLVNESRQIGGNYEIKSDIIIEPIWIDLDTRSVEYKANFPEDLPHAGIAPTDNNKYVVGARVNIMDGSGLSITRKNIDGDKYTATFAYWNTKPDGTGDNYYPNTTFVFRENAKDEGGNPLTKLTLYAIYSQYRETVLTYNKNAGDAVFKQADDNWNTKTEDYTNLTGGQVRVLYHDKLDNKRFIEGKSKIANQVFPVGQDDEKQHFTVIRQDSLGNVYQLAGWATDSDADLALARNGDKAYVNTVKVYDAKSDSYVLKNTLYAVWAICKVRDKNGKEHVFDTIQGAVDFINKTDLLTTSKAGTIEMLVDYKKPESDKVEIPSGCNITLTTAKSASEGEAKDGVTYYYDDSSHTEAAGEKEHAIITRAESGGSMFSLGTGAQGLTLQNVVLDGNKDEADSASADEPKAKLAANSDGGLVNVAAGTLTIGEGAVLRNSTTSGKGGAVHVAGGARMVMSAGSITGNGGSNGGAVYLAENATGELSGGTISGNTSVANGQGGGIYLSAGAKMTMTNGTVADNSVSGTGQGGAIYLAAGAKMAMTNGTITSNTSAANGQGAGIYLAKGSELKLSASPSFGDGNNLAPASNGATGKRQDIFIAGYLGKEGDTPIAATSLVVAGPLSSTAGSIWVGAEMTDPENPDNHYDQHKQFAVFDGTLVKAQGSGSEAEAAYNMTEDQLNATLAVFTNAHDEQYNAATGENPGYLYWDGVHGSCRVILKKVDEDRKPLAGAKFRITDDKWRDLNNGQEYESKKSGVYYIGDFAYGTYYLVETVFPEGYAPTADYPGFNENEPTTWYYYKLVVGDPGTPVEGSPGKVIGPRGTYVEGLFQRTASTPIPTDPGTVDPPVEHRYTASVQLSAAGPYAIGQTGVTATLAVAKDGQPVSPDSVTWSVAGPGVSAAGQAPTADLSFTAAGTATITATCTVDGRTVSASVEVTVKAPKTHVETFEPVVGENADDGMWGLVVVDGGSKDRQPMTFGRHEGDYSFEYAGKTYTGMSAYEWYSWNELTNEMQSSLKGVFNTTDLQNQKWFVKRGTVIYYAGDSGYPGGFYVVYRVNSFGDMVGFGNTMGSLHDLLGSCVFLGNGISAYGYKDMPGSYSPGPGSQALMYVQVDDSGKKRFWLRGEQGYSNSDYKLGTNGQSPEDNLWVDVSSWVRE